MNVVIATIKSWNLENAARLTQRFPEHRFCVINKKEALNLELLDSVQPDYVFFPHWSWIIPASIYEKHRCVVFHMTDLPFGRGGSPLQNLLVRGIYNTKISAIRVQKGMDTGDVYMQYPIDISQGSAQALFEMVSEKVFDDMIPRFLTEELVAKPQSGEVVAFTRRTPEQSRIPSGLSPRQLYDYIRMLDGEGYPPAFIPVDDQVLYFTQASFDGKSVRATVELKEK